MEFTVALSTDNKLVHSLYLNRRQYIKDSGCNTRERLKNLNRILSKVDRIDQTTFNNELRLLGALCKINVDIATLEEHRVIDRTDRLVAEDLEMECCGRDAIIDIYCDCLVGHVRVYGVEFDEKMWSYHFSTILREQVD